MLVVRHAQCPSNIYRPDISGIGGPDLSHSDLEKLSRFVCGQSSEPCTVNNGDNLPDGLTHHGRLSASTWIETSGHTIGIDFVVTSGLGRAVETALLVMVLLVVADKRIWSHPGLKEHTVWPQDQIPVGKSRVHYFEVAGGEKSPCEVLGERTIDWTNVTWPEDCAPSELSTLPVARSLEDIDAERTKALSWIREHAREVWSQRDPTEQHKEVTVLLISHSGVMSRMLGVQPSEIPNLAVYYCELVGQTPELVHVEAPSKFKDTFGVHYCRANTIRDLQARDEIQRELITRSAKESKQLGVGMFSWMSNWPGSQNFLDNQASRKSL